MEFLCHLSVNNLFSNFSSQKCVRSVPHHFLREKHKKYLFSIYISSHILWTLHFGHFNPSNHFVASNDLQLNTLPVRGSTHLFYLSNVFLWLVCACVGRGEGRENWTVLTHH